MFAGHQKLHNLIAIVDRNRLGATDFTDNYLALEPLAERFGSFGWDAVEVDGHDLSVLIETLTTARDRAEGRPLVLIAKTVKGKGVSFMENSSQWHHRMPKGDEIAEARRLLHARINEL
jgi:transketolase